MNIMVKCLFFFLFISPDGLAELVRTQRIVRATLGKDIYFECALTKTQNVVQVTWQRETSGKKENIATYSKRYGSKVIKPFQDHVSFREAGLQRCSIIIEGVRRDDETCYTCLFNIYPDGPSFGKTCLKVYELHEPTLEVEQTTDHDGKIQVFLLRCSVSGSPAPEVSVIIESDEGATLQNTTTVNVLHPNGTITVTNTSTVLLPPGREFQIKCIVGHPHMENKMVSKAILTGDLSDSYAPWYLCLGAVVGVMGLCIALAVLWYLNREKLRRELRSPNNNSKYQADSKPTPQSGDQESLSLTKRTPLSCDQESLSLTKRTPLRCNQESLSLRKRTPEKVPKSPLKKCKRSLSLFYG